MNKRELLIKMKSLLLAILLCVPLTATADIEINETNFPDRDFRNWLYGQSYGRDSVITDDEIKEVVSINVFSMGIDCLKGIEYFTALTYLNCAFNPLTTLDMSKNTALTELVCYSTTTLTALDVSGCMALTKLDCFNNPLTDLDVSNNKALTHLECANNQLTDLDVSKNTALTYLSCGGNQLTALDVSKNTALEKLYCYSNQLTVLDVSGHTALTYLECANNQLTTLNVSGCTALKKLTCQENQIKGEAMDAFINTLPKYDTYGSHIIYIYNDDKGDDGNVCTYSQIATIKEKGWRPCYCNNNGWKDYEGMSNDEAAASIALPKVENGTAEIYNLSGQKMTNPVKGGIYIIGGKKVIVK